MVNAYNFKTLKPIMKFYLLSPDGVPMNQVLFPTMIKTFEGNGHSFVNNISSCDIVLMDLHTRIADYKQADILYMLINRVPVAVFCEFDRGNMSTEIYPNPLTEQQKLIFELIDDNKIKSVHFCRLLDKNKKYNYNIFPYEKPIEYEEALLTADELYNRAIDVTYIANDAPSRQVIKKALEEDGRLKCNIILGAEKLPFNEWINENKKSKFFIAASGGGYSCEKKQNLFSIAALIQEQTDQLLLHPFTHLKDCLKINNPPTKQDLDTIFEVVNDKERLYGIYKRNYDFMKTYYSKEYIANNILKTILSHL